MVALNFPTVCATGCYKISHMSADRQLVYLFLSYIMLFCFHLALLFMECLCITYYLSLIHIFYCIHPKNVKMAKSVESLPPAPLSINTSVFCLPLLTRRTLLILDFTQRFQSQLPQFTPLHGCSQCLDAFC